MDDGDDSLIPEAHPECLEWIKKRILLLLKLPEETWSGEHFSYVTQFLVDPKTKKLFAWAESETALQLSLSQPTQQQQAQQQQAENGGGPTEVLYFFKDEEKEVVPENVDSVVRFGVAHGPAMDSFLRVMQHVFAPALLRNKQWPESVQKEFSAQLHRFLATLTENANRMRGCTVLYVPQEDMSTPGREKERLQRFESALIHWTRQIKDVLNEKDNVESSENEGPLAEIEFWRARTEDLNNIRNQLQRADVKQIVAVLTEAKSEYYLDPFNRLASMIEEGSKEAIDNLKYLNRLKPHCERLSSAEPRDIPKLLPPLLQTIQMIFHCSAYYNTPERLVGILRKVSNEIILRCSGKISLQAIFDGTVGASMRALQESMDAGEEWKRVCRQMLAATARRYREAHGKPWEIDESSIFAEIDAFVQQRCKDLLEVCEGQMQFGGRVVGELAGTSGDESP
eukprot:RCo027697